MSQTTNSALNDGSRFQSEHPWFAVRVKSNFERTTATLFRQKGYQEFLPTYQVESRWSDRIKRMEKSLFPGYVFCSFNPNQRVPILATPGVVQIVGIGKEPRAVDEQELESVWYTLSSGLPTQPHPYLQKGERVVVERGPLTGVEGIVSEFKGACRLVVAITLLQRAVSAEIERDWVRPIRRAESSTVIMASPSWADTSTPILAS
jgi:transcription antitermination factor NusG